MMDTISILGIKFYIDANSNALIPMTQCCGTIATGTDDGVACRSCYGLVSEAYGDCVTAEDGDEGLYSLIAELKGGNHRNSPASRKRVSTIFTMVFA